MKEREIHYDKIITLLGWSTFFLAVTCVVAFHMRPCGEGGENCPDFLEWINNGPITPSSLAVGFSSSIAFGMIDSILLMSGIDAFNTVFERLPGGKDPVVNAGYGNAFSSMISMLGSSFVGKIISDITGTTAYPLWSQAIGVVIGGLLGIFLPRMVQSLF